VVSVRVFRLRGRKIEQLVRKLVSLVLFVAPANNLRGQAAQVFNQGQTQTDCDGQISPMLSGETD